MNKHFKVLFYSLFVNMFLVIAKIIFGFIGNSGALIADAIHSLSDSITDIFSMFGIRFASSKADKEHPYGHGRLEYLISIGIGLVIIGVGLGLLRSSIFASIKVPTAIVAYVIVFDIIIKYFLARYILKKGKEYNSNILISSGVESSADVASSVVVLISYIGSKLMVINDIFKYSDKVGGAIVSCLILYTGFKVLKENIVSILGHEENDERYLKEVNDFIIDTNGVLSVNNVSIQKYGPYNKAIVEIGVNSDISVVEAHKIAQSVEDNLIKGKFRIAYVTVHIDAYEGKG